VYQLFSDVQPLSEEGRGEAIGIVIQRSLAVAEGKQGNLENIKNRVHIIKGIVDAGGRSTWSAKSIKV